MLWTELSLILRDGVDEAETHIDAVSHIPLVLEIRSCDANLVERQLFF
jgi:hypothetical protein